MRAYVSLCTLRRSEEFDPEEMGVACVAALVGDRVYFFDGDLLPRLPVMLSRVDEVVGANDFTRDALATVGEFDAPFVGLQSAVSDAAGTRVSLANVARATLGVERPDTVSLPLEWRSGRHAKVRRALKRDAELLRRLHREAREGTLSYVDPGTMETRAVEVEV